MRLSKKTFRFAFLLVIIFHITTLLGQEKPTALKSIPELQKALENVLDETQTPAVGLALINSDGSTWVSALGKADIENDIDANENTLFRIGSTSKMFVSLAVLKLQEEGVLHLKDTVRNLVPEIEFNNPWKATAPILIEHLLEHTTGWDDIHLTEYAHNVPHLTLKEGLDFHPHSRTSRWIPGTRMAYCNSGPAVAAYIIEKVTGLTFENYIQQHFFDPIGMETATYFNTKHYQKHAAKLYQSGKQQNYWHLIMRPSGAINASPKDMVQMLRYFIDTSHHSINKLSLRRMETPTTNMGARAGLEVGYGLTNYSSNHKQFIYRTHQGAVNGGLSDFSYLPEHNIGYAFMINSESYEASTKITQLIRDFQTKDLHYKKNDRATYKINHIVDISGYYISINPRNQLFNFIYRILDIKQIYYQNDQLILKNLFDGTDSKHTPINKDHYAAIETNKISLVRVHDPIAGEVIHTNSNVLKQTPPLIIYGQFIIAGLWAIGSISSIFLGLIWSIRYWIGTSVKTVIIKLFLGPILSSWILFVILLIIFVGTSNPSIFFGKISWISVSLTLLTICYAIASYWSALNLINQRQKFTQKIAYFFSIVLTTLHCIVTSYFMWHGLIGLLTWN